MNDYPRGYMVWMTEYHNTSNNYMNSTLYTTITQTSSKQFPGDAVGLKIAKMTSKFSQK